MSPSQQLSFVTLDVFTTSRYEGNPLAIIKVPQGLALPKESKQLIAREFNFSETVFLHETSGDSNGSPHRIDIFTTSEELPFAGHPTIGAACLVLGQSSGSKATLLVKAGPIPIEFLQSTKNGLGIVRASVPHDVHVHRSALRMTKVGAELAAAKVLGYGNADIEQAELDAPVVSIVKGMAFLLIRLPSIKHLGIVHHAGHHVDFSSMDDLLDKGPWHKSFVGRYYYVITGDGPAGTTIRSRMISDSLEDPATGSAACTLASYLALQNAHKASPGSASSLAKFEIVQGVEMGRRSKILVEVQTGASQEGDAHVKAVFLGGSAVEVTKGTISV